MRTAYARLRRALRTSGWSGVRRAVGVAYLAVVVAILVLTGVPTGPISIAVAGEQGRRHPHAGRAAVRAWLAVAAPRRRPRRPGPRAGGRREPGRGDAVAARRLRGAGRAVHRFAPAFPVALGAGRVPAGDGVHARLHRRALRARSARGRALRRGGPAGRRGVGTSPGRPPRDRRCGVE